MTFVVRIRSLYDVDETLRLWGANIRQRRKLLGLTQYQLAEAMGVRQPTVFRWEKGQMEPRRHHKAKLARVLGLDVQLLFPITRSAA